MTTTLTPLAHLTAARALLAPGPECWTKEYAGRTAEGGASLTNDMSDAICYCSVGALWRVAGVTVSSKAEGVLRETVQRTTSFNDIPSWNDHPATTHADVLRVYDLAIAAAGEAV